MPDEINPMQDMGLTHDKQLICEPQGFLIRNDCARMLCGHFIPKGERLYDLIDRYDNITSYVLNRTDIGHSGDAIRMVAPFLVAFGVSDYQAEKFFSENMKLMADAPHVVGYFRDILPSFYDSCMYDHAADALCSLTGLARESVGCTQLELDNAASDMSWDERSMLRKIAAELADMPIPTTRYKLNVPMALSKDEVDMVKALDDVFVRRLQGTSAYDMISEMPAVGANEKAYALLDIRKTTQIDMDGTAYIGGETIDYQALDLVKDGGGLAIAYNGSEFAVHGANVSVISESSLAGAVLVEQFYDTGIEGVYDLIDHWNRDDLKAYTRYPDPGLMEAMLKEPELPMVRRITKDNVTEVASESSACRKAIMSSLGNS